MSLNISDIIQTLRDLMFTNIGLLNIVYGVFGALNLYTAIQLKKQSKFGVYKVFYGYAFHFLFLAATWDLYRFPLLRVYLLYRVRNFFLLQYTIICISIIAISLVLLIFLYNFLIKRIHDTLEEEE